MYNLIISLTKLRHKPKIIINIAYVSNTTTYTYANQNFRISKVYSFL